MMNGKNGFFIILLMTVSLLVSITFAQEGDSDLRSAVQNPISSLISVPFKFSYDSGAENGDGYILNIMPVVPVTLGDWNLVNRLIAPMGKVDGAINGLSGNPSPVPGDGASGLGDFNYSVFD